MTENLFDRILIPVRLRKSDICGRVPLEEFFSDKSRIIYSSSFRRLQQKAQVFSLELNSSVRSRLTHSLEVADVGKILASRIARQLWADGKISAENAVEIPAVVENACLMHDIGNPPFGHFGEAALIKWAKDLLPIYAGEACIDVKKATPLLADFYEFDGNPQGIRIISRLHCEKDEFALNLTIPSLLAAVKYARAPGEPTGGQKIKKKAGYFKTEEPLIEKACKLAGWEKGRRYPLTYIMEAADDISYCLSDVSDAVKKKIVSPEEFLASFQQIWQERYGNEEIPVAGLRAEKDKDKGFGAGVCIDISHKAVDAAAAEFVARYEEFCSGTADELITKDMPIGRVLDVIKTFSAKYIYQSEEAESIELSGFSVITGLLNRYFSRLLRLSREDFASFVEGKTVKGLAYEKHLFNRLSKRCIQSYQYQLQDWLNDVRAVEKYGADVLEWWLRVHLIVDHVSGMTDNFALFEYQMLEGIRINN